MTDLRESVARAILGELRRRKGLRHLLEEIECDDPEIYAEIEKAVSDAALRAVADAGPTDAMIEAAARELFIQDAREYADESDDVAEWWDTTDTRAKWIAIARAAVAAAMKEMD